MSDTCLCQDSFKEKRGKKILKTLQLFRNHRKKKKKKKTCQICRLAPQPQCPSSVERAPKGYCHRFEPCALVQPWCQSTVGGERQPCAACSRMEKCNTRPEWLSIARRVQCSRAASPWKVVGTKGEALSPGRAACTTHPPTPSPQPPACFVPPTVLWTPAERWCPR